MELLPQPRLAYSDIPAAVTVSTLTETRIGRLGGEISRQHVASAFRFSWYSAARIWNLATLICTSTVSEHKALTVVKEHGVEKDFEPACSSRHGLTAARRCGTADSKRNERILA